MARGLGVSGRAAGRACASSAFPTRRAAAARVNSAWATRGGTKAREGLGGGGDRRAPMCSASRTFEDVRNNVEGFPDSRGETLVPFYKYHGLGNDFIMIDNRSSPEPLFSPEESEGLCDRRFGIGADGIIFLMSPTDEARDGGADYAMRMYNSDGSEPEMCGNGIRCLARFLCEVEGHDVPRKYNFDTLAGTIVPEVHPNGLVSVDMGEPRLQAGAIPTNLESNADGGAVVLQEVEVGGPLDAMPDVDEMFMPYEERMARSVDRRAEGATKEQWLVSCVSMGNPHAVTFGRPGKETLGGCLNLAELDVDRLGPLLEAHECFPEKANIHFCEAMYENPESLEDLTDAVKVIHWERGAGRTLACGTGACAVVVAGVLEGRLKEKCLVYVPGGPLQIEWKRNGDNHVIMTGPAQLVYKGILPA